MTAPKPRPRKGYAESENPDALVAWAIRLPDDTIEALNAATIANGRPSASEMARIILAKWLRHQALVKRKRAKLGLPYRRLLKSA